MDPTLSEAIKEAYASADVRVVAYDTLEIAHPSFTQPIYVVRDWQDLVATLEDGVTEVTFVRFKFDLTRPEVSPDGVPQCRIDMDNVTREIMANLMLTRNSTEMIAVRYRQYIDTDLSRPQNDPPLRAVLTNIKADLWRVRGVAGFGDYNNKRFPTDDFTAERFPGLVA